MLKFALAVKGLSVTALTLTSLYLLCSILNDFVQKAPALEEKKAQKELQVGKTSMFFSFINRIVSTNILFSYLNAYLLSVFTVFLFIFSHFD